VKSFVVGNVISNYFLNFCQRVPFTVETEPTTTIILWELPLIKLVRSHAESLLGTKPEAFHPAVWEAMVTERFNDVKRMKGRVREFARPRIKEKMLCVARTNNMTLDGRLVQTFSEIKTAWRKGGVPSEEGEKIMFEIMYGWSDNEDGWETRMEDEYMQANKMRYDRTDVRPAPLTAGFGLPKPGARAIDPSSVKGCVAWQFTNVKGDLVKQLQSTADGTHGFRIVISRQSVQITKESILAENEKENGSGMVHAMVRIS